MGNLVRQGDKMTVINIYYEDHKTPDMVLCKHDGLVLINYKRSRVQVCDSNKDTGVFIKGKVKHKVLQSGLVVIDIYNAEYDF